MHLLLFILPAIFAIGNLQAESPTQTKALEPTKTIDADLDQEGRVVITKTGNRTAALHKGRDFGMMVFYSSEKSDPNPLPTYKLFLQSDRKIVTTQSFDDFTKALDQIPAGSNVFLYDLCTSGSHHGMPEKYMKSIRVALKKRKLTLSDGGIICTCPD